MAYELNTKRARNAAGEVVEYHVVLNLGDSTAIAIDSGSTSQAILKNNVSFNKHVGHHAMGPIWDLGKISSGIERGISVHVYSTTPILIGSVSTDNGVCC